VPHAAITPEEAEKYLALWEAAVVLEEARMVHPAAAIKQFVRGKATSLDHAFGLKRGPGRPKGGNFLGDAVTATLMGLTGKSMAKICRDMGYDDPRELTKIIDREWDAILEEISARIDAQSNKAGK
jgi:hypothetical protein